MTSTAYNHFADVNKMYATHKHLRDVTKMLAYHLGVVTAMVRNAGQLPQPFWLGAACGGGSRSAAPCTARTRPTADDRRHQTRTAGEG